MPTACFRTVRATAKPRPGRCEAGRPWLTVRGERDPSEARAFSSPRTDLAVVARGCPALDVPSPPQWIEGQRFAGQLARKGFPHGQPRQSPEGPERSGGPAKRVDGRG